jgi:hypothetical protein
MGPAYWELKYQSTLTNTTSLASIVLCPIFGGEEEEENLRAIDMLYNVFNSYATQPCSEREHKGGSQKGH